MAGRFFSLFLLLLLEPSYLSPLPLFVCGILALGELAPGIVDFWDWFFKDSRLRWMMFLRLPCSPGGDLLTDLMEESPSATLFLRMMLCVLTSSILYACWDYGLELVDW